MVFCMERSATFWRLESANALRNHRVSLTGPGCTLTPPGLFFIFQSSLTERLLFKLHPPLYHPLQAGFFFLQRFKRCCNIFRRSRIELRRSDACLNTGRSEEHTSELQSR